MEPGSSRASLRAWGFLGLALLLTMVIYWPGLSGAWLFDDYPNIVDNRGVQPPDASISSLARAALSSPSSEFKRPLASLSFAANYLMAGLDPYWMKVTNLFIHLLNGLLVFLFSRGLFDALTATECGYAEAYEVVRASPRNGWIGAIVAAAWMILPVNLTGVLYVVQRMESMANVFVLLGLVGYVTGRRRMLAGRRGLVLCALSVTIPTGLGLLAKETAVMLPLYAATVEWLVFGFRRATRAPARDQRLLALFAVTLVLPMLAGLAWIVPHVLRPSAFATRDFTLGQRLLSEARIVVDYIGWILLPTPDALSFYHDDFHPSTGLLGPWTTLSSMVVIATLIAIVFKARHRYPLVSLGLGLYFGCHLLTGTILPLELIYEHRNYFASIGLLLVVVPLLAAPRQAKAPSAAAVGRLSIHRPLAMSLPRHVALGVLFVFWTAATALTAYAWGNPLRLAQDLAGRAPQSPRAQYELGRTYIIYSRYDPASPFTELAYAPLERAMRLPDSSILPEQALIFMNARMGLPIKAAWWDSMVAKLKSRRPGVQDESSLGALTQCQREHACNLPKDRMVQAFLAALSHPPPNARLLATYADYAWNVLDDHPLGLRMAQEATKAKPDEPAYLITLVRMLAASGRGKEAGHALAQLEKLNIGNRLAPSLAELRSLPGVH
jgi:hypothetical protein